MKLLILKDPLIPQAGLLELQKGFSRIYETYAGITPQFIVESLEYTSVPTELDNDGDTKPTVAWIKEQTAKAYKRYHVDIDHVVFLVHQDNWIFDGIWGSNWSNIYNGYQVELCRFDKKNPANSLGTLYHEVMHSHDAFIKAMTGVDINPIVGVDAWDGDVVHGGRDTGFVGWSYIRHMENTKSLELIAPELRKAYAKRQELWSAEKRKLVGQIITLAQQTIVLLRAKLHQKHT
jgi:hypothetical protein